MATTTELPVTVRSRNFRDLPATTGSITRIDFDKPDRVKNAVKFFWMGMALTFCFVFVPIAHWFLVPLAFVGTCIFSLEKVNETARSLGGKAECPKCHHQFLIDKSKIQDRITDTCGNCHEDVELVVQGASAS